MSTPHSGKGTSDHIHCQFCLLARESSSFPIAVTLFSSRLRTHRSSECVKLRSFRAPSDHHGPPGSRVLSNGCFHLSLLSCELDTSFIASHSNVSARSNANEIVSPSTPSGLSDMVDLRIIFPLLFMTKACGLAKG